MTDLLFSHARVAFKYGLKSYNLSSNDSILIPDFVCDVILHPLKELRINYSFFSLNDDLTPDWESVKENLESNTKAILMIHYFGHPQNIDDFKQFCETYDLLLIEDNAHGFGGFFNGKELGTFGEIGFSSPRKILNLPSGGQLKINNSKQKEISKKIKELPRYKIFKIQLLLSEILNLNYYFKSFLKYYLKKQPNYCNPFAHRDEEVSDLRIDTYSEKKLNSINYDKVYKKRRAIYFVWEKFLVNNGLTPVFSKLSDGAIPLVFAAYVSTSKERLSWFNWGWENRYNVHSWPTLPETVIKENRPGFAQWERMVCFPIDLNMDEDLLEKKLSKL